MQFTFTGDVPEDFPALSIGHTVEPGEVVELDKDPKHPRLERVPPKDAAKTHPKETN